MEQHKCRKIKCEEIGEVGWVFYLYMSGLSTYKQPARRDRTFYIYTDKSHMPARYMYLSYGAGSMRVLLSLLAAASFVTTHTHTTPLTHPPPAANLG